MTPQEKAKELVDKFNVVGLQQRAEAYQCAVIAVDEIIASNPIAFDEDDNCIEKQWWKEVKKEIELL
jgi:hypothetical protein